MSEKERELEQPAVEHEEDSTATATRTRPTPKKAPPKQLPPWKVLLHNDDTSEMHFVIETIVMLTPLGKQEALTKMLEAHETGVALLLTTHQERAELYRDQFASRGLTVTIEPAEE